MLAKVPRAFKSSPVEPVLGGPLWLRVQSRSRMRLRIAASIAFLFRASLKTLSALIKEIDAFPLN